MAVTSYQHKSVTLYRVRIQLKSYRFPTIRFSEQMSGIKSEVEAQRIEVKFQKELQRKITEAELQRNITGHTWSGVLEDWYQSQKNVRVRFGSISQYVLDDYFRSMKKWMATFDRVPCADIKPLDLMQLFNEMADQGVSHAHRKKIRTTLKSVFEHGIQAGLINIARNPAHDLVLKKGDEKKPEILTIGEIRKLTEIAFAVKHDWRHVWALALLTGMRNGELFALQWSDIDWDNKLLTVSRSFNCRKREISSTKAGYWRDVPMSKDCVRLLQELRLLTGNQTYILPRLNRWDHGVQAAVLRNFCMENGIPSVRFHTLRACFGTQLLRQGVPSVVVMKIAGWKDLKTMQRYIRLAGVEVVGATDKLSVLPPEEIAANVVAFRPRG